LLNAAAAVIGRQLELPSLDISEMLPILIGMLGLGGFRTYEKMNGVSRENLVRQDTTAGKGTVAGAGAGAGTIATITSNVAG
jgi:hypothetical protein